MNKKYILMMEIFGVISLVLFGWVSNDFYKYEKNQRTIDGFFNKDSNEIETKEKAKNLDSDGDWVCVNVKGMSYERAIEVINHEVGHEIFAEQCEKNITRCFKVIENDSNG